MHVADLANTKMTRGGLAARAAAGLPFLLREGMEVAFVPPQHDAPRRARVRSVRDEGKGRYRVAFEGIDDYETAERIAGMSILARREDLPEEVVLAAEEDLCGWEVRDERLGCVGRVTDLLESPGQALLEVERPGAEEPALIPLVDAFVLGFDEEARRIEVSLPDGLLDL